MQCSFALNLPNFMFDYFYFFLAVSSSSDVHGDENAATEHQFDGRGGGVGEQTF